MGISTAARLGGFAVVAVAVFGGAYGIGTAVGPLDTVQNTAQDAAQGTMRHEPGGLRASERGYTFAVQITSFAEEQPKQFECPITAPDGVAVTAFDPNHDRRTHLIIARRDLSGYQHLHPALGADVSVSGDARPVPLSPPSGTAQVEDSDYAVRPTGRPVVGEAKVLRSVSHGAYGHLVALPEGDLGYLHVHPGKSAAGPSQAPAPPKPGDGHGHGH